MQLCSNLNIKAIKTVLLFLFLSDEAIMLSTSAVLSKGGGRGGGEGEGEGTTSKL